MSLCNIYGYLYGDEAFKGKTIKLSDSYQVRIRLNDSDFAAEEGLSDSKSKFALRIPQPDHNEVELFECTSVTLPSYKPKEDIFEYGNNSKSFIYMDPTSLDDLEIELIEHYNNDNTLIVQNLVNLFLSKLFDEEAFVYKLDDYIPELTVLVFSNIFCPVILRYVFKELKLTDYTKYDLDYSSTDIAKWTLKFSYRSFYVVEEDPEFRVDEAEDVTEEDVSSGDTEEKEETTSAPSIDVPDPTQTEDKKEQDQTPPKQDDNPMDPPAEQNTETPPNTDDAVTAPPAEQNTETPSNADDAVTAPPENAENAGQQPSENNTELKNQFNATGEQPDKQPTDNEVVLDEVAIKADKPETNTAANSNPVELEKLSEEDRIDELAYRMMRGELDNGKPRYGKTYDAGYSEEERSKAQSVVNEMDWEGLKERHDARVANMVNEAPTENIAAKQNDATNTITPKNETSTLPDRASMVNLINANSEKNAKESTVKQESLTLTGPTSTDTKPETKTVKEDTKPVKEEPKPAPKPEQKPETKTPIKEEPKQEAKKEKSETPKKKYYDDDGPKYVSGMESKNGLTLNQWAYISAKQDYEAEKDDKKRNSEGYRGGNFSVGIMQVPMKEKMNYQQKYHEEMKLLQNPQNSQNQQSST